MKDTKATEAPEERSVKEKEKIADIVNGLFRKDGPTISCGVTLLAARQLYYAALQALRERMTELDHGPADGVEQAIIAAMESGAMRPFELYRVVDKIQGHILPWLQARIQSSNEQELAERKEVDKKSEEERRSTELPIGFSWQRSDQVFTELPRKRPLVLAGHPRAVNQLLNLVGKTTLSLSYNEALNRKPTLLRMSLLVGTIKKQKRGSSYIAIVPFGAWARKGTSRKTLGEILSRYVTVLRTYIADLLIIDDISMLTKPLVAGSSDQRTAVEALSHVRKCAEMLGCGVVAGLPIRVGPCEEKPDFESTDWKSLSGNCDLQWVSCEDAGFDEDYGCDVYRIKVGDIVAVDAIEKTLIDKGVPS